MVQLSGMVRNLALVITFVPMSVSIILWALYNFLYPITPEFTKKMTDEFKDRRVEKLHSGRNDA